jgi:hypothetical protein
MAISLINDSTFWITMSTLIIGSFAVIVRACYRSKCKNFNCCFGLIHIERDTDAEEKIDLERGLRSDSIPQRS